MRGGEEKIMIEGEEKIMRGLIFLPIGERRVTMKGEMKEEEIGGMIGEKIKEKKEEMSSKGVHLGGTLHLAL